MPAPLRPTIATAWPVRTGNETSRRMPFPASSYVKLTFRNSMPCRSLGSGSAPGRSLTSECVSRISKIRSEAAIACWRLAFTRLNFFTGAYIMKAAARNDVNSPCVSGRSR